MAGSAGSIPVREETDLLADQLAHPPFGSYRRPSPARLRVGSYRLGSDVFLNAWTADDLAAHARRGAGAFARLGIDRVRAVSHLLPGALGERFGIELLVALDEQPLPAAAREIITRRTGVPVVELLGVRCLYPFLGTRRTPAEPFEIDAAGIAIDEDGSGRLVVTALDLTDAPLAVRTRLRGRIVDRTAELVRLILEEPSWPPES